VRSRRPRRIRTLLQQFANSADVELQQRANEYLALFQFESVRYGRWSAGIAVSTVARC